MILQINTSERLQESITLLQNTEPIFRAMAAKNLCYVTDYRIVDFEKAIPALTNALKDPDGYVRERVAEAIGNAAEHNIQIPDETVNGLRNIMKNDANQGARKNAQDALIACGKLERRIDASARQLDLFVPRSMGESHALLMRMQRTTPRPVRQATA